jgi:phosphatidylglycerol:prolipoprotein diacylglycerol transferase
VQFPINLNLGPIIIPSHLVFEVLGYVLGFRYYLILREKTDDHISEYHRMCIMAGGAFGALIFSRLIGALENPHDWMASSYPLLYLYQTKTIMGGLAGGLLGVEIVKKVIGEKRSSGDLFTLPLILAIMIGRIGCFLSGVSEPTFGIETTMPWGMDLGDGLFRHPTSLYEILFLLAFFFIMKAYRPYLVKNEGRMFRLFMLIYFGFRFLIEFIKPVAIICLGLSTIQLLSLFIFIYYSLILSCARK